MDTKDNKIAISFDATWGAEYTPRLLEILNKYNVKSTFFLTNIWLKDYPDVAKTIRFAGHEIGMHSVSHPHMNNLSEETITKELNENAELIKQTTNFEPILFRPPFGEYNNKLIIQCKNMGYVPVQWSVDSLDWKESLSKEDIVKRVTEKIHPGAIVLFHNNGRYTADALAEILEFVFAEGYEVIPISQLLYKENYYIDHTGAQKQIKK